MDCIYSLSCFFHILPLLLMYIVPAVSLLSEVIEVFENETEVLVTLVRKGDTSLPATVHLRTMQLFVENAAISE